MTSKHRLATNAAKASTRASVNIIGYAKRIVSPLIQCLRSLDQSTARYREPVRIYIYKHYKCALSNPNRIYSSRQIRTDQIEAAQLGAQQNLETIRRGFGWIFGCRGIRSGHAPDQHQTGRSRVAHRFARSFDAADEAAGGVSAASHSDYLQIAN